MCDMETLQQKADRLLPQIKDLLNSENLDIGSRAILTSEGKISSELFIFEKPTVVEPPTSEATTK